ADCTLQVLGGLGVLAGLVLLEAYAERRAARHRKEDGAPHRVSDLLRLKLQLRHRGERFAELVTALRLPARRALDEREVLVRSGLVAFAQAELERCVERLGGGLVIT